MDIFILGHTGFLGSSLYQHLRLNNNYNVIGMSSETINLSDESSINILQKILLPGSIIIMCIGVKKQLGDNIDIFEKNMFIINNFVRAVSKVHPKKIIFFSSASVYGEDVAYHENITEETPVRLRSYYGIAKYMAESLLEKCCADKQIELVILRPPLVYGKDDHSLGYGPTGFSYKAVNNEKIILWGDGSELREFVYIDDLVLIVNMLIHNEFVGILNIISGKSYSYGEVLSTLNKIMGMNVSVELRERTKEKVDHHFSNGLIKEVFDNFVFTDLESGLQKLCRSIRNS